MFSPITRWFSRLATLDASSRTERRPGQESAEPLPNQTWEAIERQDWHLWILVILLLLVLGGSLVSFMFPEAFWSSEDSPLRTAPRAFWGFCVLIILALAYMFQRQATVRTLRRQLYRALLAATETERKRFESAVEALPGLNPFRDSLAMEYRRALTSGAHLSLILFDLPQSLLEERGRAAEILRQMLRSGESLFGLPGFLLGAILPNMQQNYATAFATQVEATLKSALPALTVHSTVTTYPGQANSLSELEAALRSRVW